MGSLSGLRDQNVGENGAQDQKNGKKIGINGSWIYHVTTLILMAGTMAQNILAKSQLNHAITYVSTPCGNHTITQLQH